MTISRRRLLIGGAATVVVAGSGLGLVEAGVLPGRARLNELLGWDGGTGEIPVVAPGPVIAGVLDSAAVSRPIGWNLLLPPGNRTNLPVVVALHGRGGDHGSAVSELSWDRYLAAAVNAGTLPFAIVTADGGDLYWHRRSSGDDLPAMIVDDLLPTVRTAHPQLDKGRIGIAGWSMGGYGALLLAEQLGVEGVAAVSAVSPAVFTDFPSAAGGAFDDESDFRAHDVVAGIDRLKGVPVQLLCGEDDPFADAVTKLMDLIEPRPSGGISTGGHSPRFWTRMAPEQMQFLGNSLAAAGR